MLESPESAVEQSAPAAAVAFPVAPSVPSGIVDGTLPSDEDLALASAVRKGARLADDFIAGVVAEGWVPRARADLSSKTTPKGKAPNSEPARVEEQIAEENEEDGETIRKAKEAREEPKKKGPPPSSAVVSSSDVLESVENPTEQSASEDPVDVPAAQSVPSDIVDSISLPSGVDPALASTVRKGARLADAFLAGVVAEGWVPRGRPDTVTKPKKAGKVPPPDPAKVAEQKAKKKKEDEEQEKKARAKREEEHRRKGPPPPPPAGASASSSSTGRTRL